MIDGLKPYPEYKDSGVPWLGEVPQHWEVRRNGRLFAQRNDTGFPELPILEVSLRSGVRVRDFDATSRKQVMSDRAMYKRAVRGDITYNMMRMWQGAVGAAPVDGLVSPAYLVARPLPGTMPGYCAYLYRTDGYKGEIDNFSRGIVKDRNRLYWEQFKQIPTPYPPTVEQASIVRFLDHADRRIRLYIRAKQKLIKLLEEQKQAVIHRAVTRGLDPKVRLKPSGVEWLGDVPEHWAVQRLGRISRVFNGTTPSRMQPAYWQDGTVPWLSSGKVNDWVIESASELVTERAMRECSLSLVPRGAVIVGLVGQGKTRGKSALLGLDACINQNLAAILPSGDIRGSYLLYFLTAFYRTLREFGRGGNQEALNCEIVANWRVPIPPDAEQRAICNHLNERLAEGRTAERRVAQEIDLLHEYRTRLIADVVTGKLDVREAAARLPDEPDETEPLDEAPAQDEDADEADMAEGAAPEMAEP